MNLVSAALIEKRDADLHWTGGDRLTLRINREGEDSRTYRLLYMSGNEMFQKDVKYTYDPRRVEWVRSESQLVSADQ